jgi:hypothetical protein
MQLGGSVCLVCTRPWVLVQPHHQGKGVGWDQGSMGVG